MNMQRAVCTLVAIATLALAGCGGGGPASSMDQMGGDQMGNDGSMPRAMVQQPSVSVSVFDDLNATQVVADNTVLTIGKAAEATPRAGSVTQSSNADNNGVTTDRVDVTAEYGTIAPRFSIRNGTEWSIYKSEGNPRPIPDTTPPWKGATLSKRVSGGTVYVEAYSDIEAPETRINSRSNPGGSQVVPIGMTLQRSFPITINTVNINLSGTLDSNAGRFQCSGGCSIVNNVITRGSWRFTRNTPTGFINVSNKTNALVTGPYDQYQTPGRYNGQAGYFRCDSGTCTLENGDTTLGTGDWLFFPRLVSTTLEWDTDYLAGGVWLVVPDDTDSADDYVFGAFVDGSDPFGYLVPLQGTATYEGAAIGVFSVKDGQSTKIGSFNGNVELTANFGGRSDPGTISGSLDNLEMDRSPVDGRLVFGTANIGNTNGGFFQSTITGTVGSDNSDFPERAYEGRGSGQFFGHRQSDGRPGSVGGTFGVQSTDDVVNFVGIFGAHKQ